MGAVRLDVEAQKKCPCLAACASLWRLPSLLAMTHMRLLHGQRGQQSTDYVKVWSSVRGLRTWPNDGCSNKDAGKSERGTPIPCKEAAGANAEFTCVHVCRIRSALLTSVQTLEHNW